MGACYSLSEASMKLLLVRHGETIDNINRAIGSRLLGPPLSDIGRAQAASLSTELAGRGLARLHSSRALRAAQTAATAASALGIPHIEMDGVHEIDAGDLEGQLYADAMADYAGTMQRWWTDRSARIPGGESGAEFMTRFDAAINALAAQQDQDATFAVVSHEAAILVWASSTATNLDAEFSRTHGVRNTGIVELEGSPSEGWRAMSWDGLTLPL